MQYSPTYIILGLLLLSVSLCLTTETDSLGLVTRECEAKLKNINSVSEFKGFMEHYRVVLETTDKPKRGLLNNEKNLRKCFDQSEMLFALEKLMTDQGDGVCQLEYIDKLIDYHLKNVVKSGKDDNQELDDGASLRTRKSFAARIFSLFAHQVVLTCKSQLVDRVGRIAEPLHKCDTVLDLVLPAEIRRTDSDDERLALFKEFLTNFERVEDFRFLSSGTHSLKSYYQSPVPKEAEPRLFELKKLCHDREPLYTALFQPISSLSQLGYEVEDVPVDSNYLRCWLAVGQFCQGILRLHLQAEGTDPGANPCVKIKFDQPPEDVLIEKKITSEALPAVMRFNDHVDEFAPMIIGLINKKSSMVEKLKRSLKLFKKFIPDRVKLDASQNQIARQFEEVVTRGEEDTTKACALNGRPVNSGVFAPWSVFTDSFDSVIALASLCVDRVKSFVISMALAMGFIAVYIYFVICVAFRVVRPSNEKKIDFDRNFKQDVTTVMGERNKKLLDSVQKKGIDKRVLGQVYVGPINPMV